MPKHFQFGGCLTILVLVVLVDAAANVQKGVNNDDGGGGGSISVGDASLLHAAKQAFPLRDDRDYESLTNNDEYDDEDYDQTEYGDDKLEYLSPDDDDDDEDEDGDDDMHHMSSTADRDHHQHRMMGKTTVKPYSATSTSLFCPEKCSCLGDFIECKNLTSQLPRIPNSVQEL